MAKTPRIRIDVLLVKRGHAPTRTKAQALVLAGNVSCGCNRIDKPGQLVDREIELRVRPGRRWVGRGAQKLAPALDAFKLDPSGLRVLDVGASTGGFTQLLLERGAVEVIALDVGRNQIDWRLRSDARVRVMEGVNARSLVPADLAFVPDWAVMDVSFISLEKVLQPVASKEPTKRGVTTKPSRKLPEKPLRRSTFSTDVRSAPALPKPKLKPITPLSRL